MSTYSEINAKTKLCCLIGKPVGHSLSPLIHNTIARELGINLCYTAFSVDTDRLSEVISGAEAMDFLGMNVTVPHKCNVIKELKEIDPLAEKIGAVNTLVRVPKGYKGYNTDVIGLKRELLEEGISISDNEIIILGAGGASRAITYLCAAEGAKRVYLLNRTRQTAVNLANEVNSYFGDIIVPLSISEYTDIPKGKYPVIQTTSAGLHPKEEEAPIYDDAFYELVEVGVDIIFNPSETCFMKLCKAHNAKAFNGLKMLLYQGIAAFELWNDIKISDELAAKVLRILEEEL